MIRRDITVGQIQVPGQRPQTVQLITDNPTRNGTFVTSVTGGTGGTNSEFLYEILGNICTISTPINSSVVTSTSTALTLPNLPDVCNPLNSAVIPCIVVDNGIGNNYIGRATVNGNTVTFGMGAPFNNNGFTAAGTKGLPIGWSITYPLN